LDVNKVARKILLGKFAAKQRKIIFLHVLLESKCKKQTPPPSKTQKVVQGLVGKLLALLA